MNTAPQEIASRICSGTIPISVTTPDFAPNPTATLRNVRYVGALSRKLESAPSGLKQWSKKL